MKRNRGFTLLEVLLAVSLVAMVALALYSTFNSGIRVMSLVNQPGAEEDLNIFFEKLSRDLQNSFHYATIPFQGKSDRFSFATTIQTDEELGGDHGIGRVTYAYDSAHSAILRTQENISQIYKEKTGPSSKVFFPLSSFQLQYYKYDPVEKAYEWKEEWEETANKMIPLAVKVVLHFQEEGREQSVARTIAIPVGG